MSSIGNGDPTQSPGMTHRAGATVYSTSIPAVTLMGKENGLDATPDMIPVGRRVPTRPKLQSSGLGLNDSRKRLPSFRDVRGIPLLRILGKPTDDRTNEITQAPMGLDHERRGQSPVPRPLGTLFVSGGGSVELM